MWQQKKLKVSEQVENALVNGQSLKLSVQGTKIGVHNWTHGIEEKSNRYLSPENAVKVFADKLLDYSDPNRPKNRQDIIAIMVTSSDIDEFILHLESVQVLLPEHCFQQALDYAKSSKSLADTKMIKTPTIASPAFANSADITPGSNRSLQSILRNVSSIAVSAQTGDPMIAIQNLMQLKQQREQQNQQKVQQIMTAQGAVYAFSVKDFLETAQAKIQLNIPPSSNIFTACVLYIGNDLSPIRGMLYD